MNITHIEEHELVTFHDLPDEVKPDFDWDTEQEGSYFEYRGTWYSLEEFMRTDNHTLEGEDEQGNPVTFEADGIAGQSYFHAVAVKVNHSGDGVIAASIYS